ncbi:hypothetical protein JTE90_018796 [Oedothorax gibbosus]|uniref:AMP-dependent synthetase/ligase domain-containing protein n=1 Tax=Oedothorax gibbosus TaxID=931172 RepID=A0AAV6TSM2_9ARAC|nr:hypothetical protein JTE90_018796 [Oedothorax gibbosus]
MLPKIKEITNGLPSLEKVIIVASKEESYSKDISGIRNSCFLKDFLQEGLNKDGTVPELVFEQVSFQHPLFISYTSGTTGLPKALVHGCGMILSSFKDFHFHTDCTRESVWFSMSPVGWGTWCLCLTLHFIGHTMSIFEGVPYFINPKFFWNLVEEHRITHLYLPTGIADELKKRKYAPTKENLKYLKCMMAGGSVVKPELYDFLYKNLKKDIPFASSFGATEFLGSSMLIDTNLPIHRGEIPAIALASDIYTVNNKGDRVIGELGELVLGKAMPNLPLGIWKDEDGSVMKEKYFSKYSEKFSMGDYAIINPITNGTIICCRSDETLKQRGCRFGSSEIYGVLDGFPEVGDSICVSKYSQKMDESAVLFLKMSDGYVFNTGLVDRIRKAIAETLTPRHVPDIILETKDIPYNINSKKMEITVKKIINNKPYNADSIRNPQCLKYYSNLPELDID